MKLKRTTRHTALGTFYGFTGAPKRKPSNVVHLDFGNIGLRRWSRFYSTGGITSGIEAFPAVSWAARLCYRLGWRKLARCV